MHHSHLITYPLTASKMPKLFIDDPENIDAILLRNLKPNKDRNNKCCIMQRGGAFESAEKLLDINNVMRIALAMPGRAGQPRIQNTIMQDLDKVRALISRATPAECGLDEEQHKSLVERYVKYIKEMHDRYLAQRAKNVKSKNKRSDEPAAPEIDDWEDFAERGRRHYQRAKDIYYMDVNNLPAGRREDFEQRVALMAYIDFTNVRSAWHRVVRFDRPDVDLQNDDVLMFDPKDPNMMFINWHPRKGRAGKEGRQSWIQSLHGSPYKHILHEYLTKLPHESKWIFPGPKGKMMTQDTFRRHIQQHCEMFYDGRKVGVMTMRHQQITWHMDQLTKQGASEERIQFISKQYHHSAVEQRLYVQRDATAEADVRREYELAEEEGGSGDE